ncbi:hypothetical protein [Bacillus sp. S/N-304-OC-R1]|uniref:hypothetical protein n=1 Tax=Bacillus sp. S/N-304-OC-R1 TaxID=2758034 RepID=UPI001C8EFD5F|nr:hypothetical protein [Bacillus sp. S/N-304-OC-R1]MBY0121832.1 hypothetical protein [Bacillus sp. S/N-304-OC-R1]
MQNKLRLILFGCITLLLMSAFPFDVKACSCAELPSIEEEFDRSQAVFSGKVIRISETESMKGYRTKTVLFEVINTWKGVTQSQIIIRTGQGGGDCGIDFIEGIEYLVYANESDMYGPKELVTIICDRTNKLSASQEDIQVLGAGTPPTEMVDLTKKIEEKQERIEEKQKFIWGAVILTIGIGAVLILLLRGRKKRK